MYRRKNHDKNSSTDFPRSSSNETARATGVRATFEKLI